MPFDRFMDMALYDAESGYFAAGELRSARSGDFLTSPEVSPLFGATIATYVTSVWDRAGRPGRFIVCEVAAGSGSLIEPLLANLTMDVVPVAIEASAAARAMLASRLPDVTVAAALDALPSEFDGVVIANELLDNVPMSLAVRTGPGWSERRVGVDGSGDFEFVDVPARPEVLAWLERWCGPVPDGGLVEVQLRAGEWIKSIAGRVRTGSMVLFDYGDTADGLASRRTAGTLRTYQGHHLGPPPLSAPGTTDITADVNFSAVFDVLAETGAHVRVERQDETLRSWGLGDERERLRAEELELARSGAALQRLVHKTKVNEADTLLHPRGLGDFRVAIAEFDLSQG